MIHVITIIASIVSIIGAIASIISFFKINKIKNEIIIKYNVISAFDIMNDLKKCRDLFTKYCKKSPGKNTEKDIAVLNKLLNSINDENNFTNIGINISYVKDIIETRDAFIKDKTEIDINKTGKLIHDYLNELIKQINTKKAMLL